MINWNALQGGGFQGALSQGLQLGQVVRQQQDQRDYRNAFAQFDPSRPETVDAVMKVDPRAGMELRQQAQAAQAKANEGDLAQRALRGDAAALDEMATVNFDKWKTLNTEVKAAAKTESEVLGGAALDLLQVPFEQRRDRIIAYSQRFPQFRDKIEEVAYLPEREQDLALRAVVIEAQLVGKLHEMERPQAFNVGPGEGRYERNPRTGEINTIVQPNYGGAPSFSPVAQGGGRTVTRTGTAPDGRRVVQYSDGSVEYAPN